MARIAIIGAGQLGSRHLQGLAALEVKSQIFIVDPFTQSRETALARFIEVSKPGTNHEIILCEDISCLPPSLDLAIISTNSDVRAEITRSLLAETAVKYILFEKVLFQEPDHYDEIAQLLGLKDVKAWVNCPRRIYPLYNEIHEFFGPLGPVNIDVSGGNWGLGCNAIHFIDLASYLNHSTVKSVDVSGLDEEIIESKRPGFIEVTGSLRVVLHNGAVISLTSLNGSHLPAVFNLFSDDKRVVVMEYLRQACFISSASQWKPVQKDFILPFQSQLTGDVAREIILAGSSLLPSFGESSLMHKPFIVALIGFLNDRSGIAVSKCPIT